MGGYRFKRACLDCGVLTQGDRCGRCKGRYRTAKNKELETPERKAKKKRYYNTEYQRLAKIVRATATICHICKRGPIPNDPFQADHITPGSLEGGLLPAHRSCNAARGNRPIP